MSALRKESVELLRDVRPLEPFHANVMTAEAFAEAHTIGHYQVLPRSDGGYVVVDTERELGRRTLSWHPTVDEAQKALQRWAEVQP